MQLHPSHRRVASALVGSGLLSIFAFVALLKYYPPVCDGIKSWTLTPSAPAIRQRVVYFGSVSPCSIFRICVLSISARPARVRIVWPFLMRIVLMLFPRSINDWPAMIITLSYYPRSVVQDVKKVNDYHGFILTHISVSLSGSMMTSRK